MPLHPVGQLPIPSASHCSLLASQLWSSPGHCVQREVLEFPPPMVLTCPSPLGLGPTWPVPSPGMNRRPELPSQKPGHCLARSACCPSSLACKGCPAPKHVLFLEDNPKSYETGSQGALAGQASWAPEMPVLLPLAHFLCLFQYASQSKVRAPLNQEPKGLDSCKAIS